MTGRDSTPARLMCHAASMANAVTLRANFDCSECGTLWQIGHRLRDEVCTALVEFVRREDPLKRPLSSWVWLRSTGAIVVEECDVREGERVYVDCCRDFVIAVFPTPALATPDSRYYTRIKDRRGEFYGSVASRWRGFPPVWQRFRRDECKDGRHIELLSGERATFQRFRLKPLPSTETVGRIESSEHRAALRDRILAWLIDDATQSILAAQNFSALRLVRRAKDKTLVSAMGGSERFSALLQKKAEEHLKRCLAATGQAGGVVE